MGNKGINYYIMDGRAYFNPDDAIVLEVCSSLNEARHNSKIHGDGCAIFKDGDDNKLELVE